MIEEDAQLAAENGATSEGEQAVPVRPKKTPRAKKLAGVKTALQAAKPRTRGLSDQEKLERIAEIEAQVKSGATLKDAVKAAGISDQTFYIWKKALSQPLSAQQPTKNVEAGAPDDDELFEFNELEQENQRLRKLLAEKLRAENAALRKRLGLQ